MRRYEYKTVEIKGRAWRWGVGHAEDALLDVLNREGRSGWRLVVTFTPSPVPWGKVLLERIVD